MIDKYNSTLVIIDCSYKYFIPSNVKNYDIVVNNIQKMIDYFMLNLQPIIFVEFGEKDKTRDEFKLRTENYQHVYTIIKYFASGANELEQCVKYNKLPKNLHFVGVNYNQCVQATCHNFLHKNKDYKINIYRDCSNPERYNKSPYDCSGKHFFWRDIKKQHGNKLRVKNVKSSGILETKFK